MDYQKKSKEELILELQNLQMDYDYLRESFDASIAKSKMAEEIIRESENKFRKIFEEGPFGMVMADREFKFISANAAFCKMTGYSENEILSRGIKDITYPDDISKDLLYIPKLMKGEIPVYKTEKRYVKKDGCVIWGSLTVASNFNIDGKFLYNLAIIEDITERKQVEDALKESRDLLLNLARLVPGVIYQYRLYPDGRSAFPYSSPGMFNIYEVTPEEVQEDATPVFGRLHPDDYDHVAGSIQESARTLETFYCEFRVNLPKQGLRWRWSQAHPIRMEDGGTLWHGIISDITERKEAELLLKEKAGEIEAQNEEYQQLNEELIQINKELQEAKIHAEKSDHLKTAFLQNMSHEIRTPMNAIMGFSALLPDQYNNKLKLEQYSQIINQRCSDLLDIINEILDVARIESDQLPVNLEECNLLPLFSDLASFFKEIQNRQSKQHIEFNIQTDYGASGPVIITDKVKLKQIFINLIGNAFKFTEKGTILAGCKPNKNNQLLFFVSDTGIGIPADKQNFIFERFAQIEPTPNHIYGGTGLGLSIVKGLINLLGGKIWLESELSKGTTFYFSFPYESVRSSHHEQSISEVSGNYKFPGKTLLIVEDDKYNAEFLKEILFVTGINIIHTLNGNEAIKISKSQKIDLILMDVRLPDIDGYTATRMIRKYKPDLKIIAQTAYAAHEDKEKALNAGCNDFISKPVNRELLYSILNKQFSKF